MPQLPSGLLVALSIVPALEKAKEGHFGFHLLFKSQVRSIEDVAEAISIIYYRPKDGAPEPGEAYLSGMTLSAVGTERCNWPQEDVAFFNEWLASDRVQQYLQACYEELMEAIRHNKGKVVMPDNLKGIMDDDD